MTNKQLNIFSLDFDEIVIFLACNASTKLSILNRYKVDFNRKLLTFVPCDIIYYFRPVWTIDTENLRFSGKKYVIKRFCEIHELFNASYEPRYLLNQLYIKDYLIWLQQVPPAVIDSITPMLEAVRILFVLNYQFLSSIF